MDSIRRLNDLINSSENIVFFGGAGVSTESGIPDYRSEDGLYRTKYKYPPEVMLSHDFFFSSTSEFYSFYKEKMIHLGAEPNAAHLKLAELEKAGRLRAVITQNIDGLHQKAGSENVCELHGSIHRNYCTECRRPYGAEYVMSAEDVPLCTECGGIVRPDVVLYQETLDNDVITSAVNHIKKADLLIIGGTSLAVYPAASLIHYFRGASLVLINKSEIPSLENADLVFSEKIGDVMSEVKLKSSI